MKVLFSGRDSYVEALDDAALGALIQEALRESGIGVNAPALKHDGLSHYRCTFEVPSGSDVRGLVQSLADQLHSRGNGARSGNTLHAPADLGLYCYAHEDEGLFVLQLYESGRGPEENLVTPRH
ncbi:MAG: hypothetical protein ACLFP8_08400 [Alphaproteobacteria bacterium]